MNEVMSGFNEKISGVMSKVACLIGYGQGFDSLHTAPLFIRKPEDIDKLVWNRLCVQNLAAYLPAQKFPPLVGPDEKIGVILKGCDSRSLIQLLQEGVVKRDKLVIIGLPCKGMIDTDKLQKRVNINKVSRIDCNDQTIMVCSGSDEFSGNVKDFLYDKCLTCEYPNTLVYDEFIGEKIAAPGKTSDAFAQLAQLEKMTLEERNAFWDKEFSRCIRCKACRNVCPVCYCQNQCLLDTRVPHWVKERVDLKNNKWFHLVRAFHLAGRCTECGQCARVCPANIPINLLPLKMNQELFDLFGWRAGVKEGEKSPMMEFKMEEEKIGS